MTLFRVGPSGGIGGNAFDDDKDAPGVVDNSFVSVIDVFAGQFVNSIQFFNTTSSNAPAPLPKHGVDSGPRNRIVLEPNEYIVAISGKAGQYVDSISIRTRTSAGVEKSYGPFGGLGGEEFVYEAPVLPAPADPDIVIAGVHGGAGAIIDSLGVILQRPRILWPDR
jgi:Jacalin-like lectin domain